uniref:RUBREDOXIN TRANSPORT, RUBREDOXIN, GUILLARDIA THETA n=1 Tax=Siphoviridae sp. ctS1E53 TaxID=2826340 RepID=A0A8S5MEJ2_9CAUD|nr:MAG TPA: RUBREDOXIN TRANSPORT, RUBREDOXIN, GUILLARDIA THETA [Siphoviridae sp. ctS1E53]
MLDDSYTWTCPKCYSNSPVVIWDEEKVKGMTEKEKMAYAREAALHRAEPENRVLTAEEATGSEGPVWLETRKTLMITDVCIAADSRYAEAYTIGNRIPYLLPLDSYGKLWRCWPRKPTPEQMAAAKWEE